MRLQYLEAMGIDVWLPRAVADGQQVPDLIAEPIDSWESLQVQVAQCTQCDLCKTRSHTVFGAGNKNADWMIIGEEPGQSEDQLLTEMLRAIDLDREQVFITNVVKCRSPDNCEPKAIEVETCKPYLLQQLMHIKPKIILALGHVTAQALLNTDESIDELRGKIHALNDTPVVVVYHPAYLLRSLLDKRKAWADLKLAMQTVKNIKG